MIPSIDAVIVSSSRTKELADMTAVAVDTARRAETLWPVHVFVAEQVVGKEFDARMVWPAEPFGYNRYLNEGLKLGRSEYVALCNNDVVFRTDWARSLIAAMVEYGAASASPIDPWRHTMKGIFPFSGVREGYKIGREVCGWCIMTTRTTLARIGGLDERFRFWYADHDYANTLEDLRLRHILVTSSWVEHLFSKTRIAVSDEERTALCEGQLKVYLEKWGDRGL